MEVIAGQVREIRNCGRTSLPELTPTQASDEQMCESYHPHEDFLLLAVQPLVRVEQGKSICNNRGCIYFDISQRYKPRAIKSSNLPLAE